MARNTPRRGRHGPDAVEAAIDELELRGRLDEMDPDQAREGSYDLRWVNSHVEGVDVAAATDVYTPDEALERIAGIVGRELPDEPEDDYDR